MRQVGEVYFTGDFIFMYYDTFATLPKGSKIAKVISQQQRTHFNQIS